MVIARKITDTSSNTVTLSKTFFDISRLIKENISVYPGDPKPEFDKISTIESEKVEVTKITIGSHTGTHVDAQKHFIAGGIGIDKEPLRKFIGQTQVIDLSRKSAMERIGASDLEEYAEIVKDDDILLIYTNIDSKVNDGSKITDFNYLDVSAAQWLIDHNIKSVGIDTLSIEKFGQKDGVVHKKLLSKGIGIIENLKSNFVQFTTRKVFLVCLPLFFENIDASPARAILFEISNKQ